MKVVRTLAHPDGMRRVQIVERGPGRYGYEVESRGHTAELWIPADGANVGGVYDSLETAEREARAFVTWLAEV